MSYEDEKVVVGKFFIAPGIGDGKVWIGHENGDRAGEGGDFSVEKLEELLSAFYKENF